MTKHTTDDVVRLLRATHEVMHITHQMLADIQARIHALELGQMMALQMAHKLSEADQELLLVQLRAAAAKERERIDQTVLKRLDEIGREGAAPAPPSQN